MKLERLASLLLLLAGAGCLDIEVKLREPQPNGTGAHLPRAIAPVTADRITAANARDTAQALWDEFDREEIEERIAP